MANFQGELEEKMERFELNLRTLSEAKRKYSVEGLFGWISSPRSTAVEDFDPFCKRAIEVDEGQESQKNYIQTQEEQRLETHEDSICAEDHDEHTYNVHVAAPQDAEDTEDAVDDTKYNNLVSVSETSMLTTQAVEEVSLPKPTTRTEVAIHDILSGMMDTVKHLAVSNKKMQSDHQENETLRLDRKLRRRQSRVLTKMLSVDADVDTAMGECAPSTPKTLDDGTTPLVQPPTLPFDAEYPRVEADRSLMRKPALTDAIHEHVEGSNRTKRKRTLGPFTQVKVSASESEDTTFTENSAGSSIYYKEYRPPKLRPYPLLNRIGRRLSDEAIGRHRRMHKRRSAAAPAVVSSPDESPRAVVELFLNPWASGGGGGGSAGGADAHSSGSDEKAAPKPEPRRRMSVRAEPSAGSDAKRGEEPSTVKEQSSPREVSPRVPIHRRPKPLPTATPADAAPPVRQRISWRSDVVVRPKAAAAATTSLTDEPTPADADGVVALARRPRVPRRKTAKPVVADETVERVVELELAEPEPVPDTAPTTASVQRGRGQRTRERQQRWQQRQDDMAARAIADEVTASVRAQRQWLRAQEELGGEEAILTRSYELPTVSSVMKRVVKSYMPAVGLTGIPFVVGTSTSPTHHCGLKLQAELRKFKLKLPNKLEHNSSALTTCTESELTASRWCPAAANAGRCLSSHTTLGTQRPEDRWGDACTEPNCTCCVRKTQPADKVLHQYVGSSMEMTVSPSSSRLTGSRLDLSAAKASAAALPIAGSLSNTASMLSKTDLHGESLQTLKVKIGGLKECLLRLQERFTRLHAMRTDSTLDLTEKQIADLDRKIENKEQEINVVLALMREIFTLSRSQKASVVSVAESTRSRRSRRTFGGGGGLALQRK